MNNDIFPMRINKYIAHQGLATRRQADDLIIKKQVLLNDKIAKLGDKVTKTDKVEIKKIRKKYHYYKYYKPRGLLTHSNQKQEQDISKSLSLKNIFPLGRLDKDSEGLIILTNDGRLTDRLLSPAYNHSKEYRVTVNKELKTSVVNKVKRGVIIENYKSKPGQVQIIGEKEFNLILTEGKKHQVRRICAALGYDVKKLKRTRILNINIGKLQPGEYEEISSSELSVFLNKLGLKSSEQKSKKTDKENY